MFSGLVICLFYPTHFLRSSNDRVWSKLKRTSLKRIVLTILVSCTGIIIKAFCLYTDFDYRSDQNLEIFAHFTPWFLRISHGFETTATCWSLVRKSSVGHTFTAVSFNPIKRSGVRWLHFEVFSAVQVWPTFLISDIWVLWRSELSARVPECYKLKCRLDLDGQV